MIQQHTTPTFIPASLRTVACLLAWTGVSAAFALQELPVNLGEFGQEVRTFYTKNTGLPDNDVQQIAINAASRVVVRLNSGYFELVDGQWKPTDSVEALKQKQARPQRLPTSIDTAAIQSVASHKTNVAVGTANALFVKTAQASTAFQQLFPSDGIRRWAPTNVSVAYDATGKLWFASRQGAGCLADGCQADGKWKLYAGTDGLPYDDMTSVACDRNNVVWFGTTIGAIRFDGHRWSYRQGKRWLPNDDVRDIAVDDDGNAWIATAGGISCIRFRSMTLADKADWYETEIDKHHRRTKFGYVIEAHVPKPGKKSDTQLHASDNDGLWTSMYGAGECFAYGALKTPESKRRAKAAFEALQFLSLAPRGSQHAPPNGFIARTVLNTKTHANPNVGSYSLEGQRRKRNEDGAWRVYEPRWPKSADGSYYWKSDTSSDELDGHYFFYPLYYDLVASTDAEKAEVREIVRANIDHLISHDFSLHDHAGRTRWGIYGPKELNHDPEWFEERGLKSVSMLSYLNVAFHITGDEKYRTIAAELRDKHGYHMNVMWPKYQRGLGSGNQSDDEMAFMAFYNLIKYEPDDKLKRLYTASFANSWRQEEPEMNPFFNFCFAAVAHSVQYRDIWGSHDLSPWPSWLQDSIDTLKRFPLDRFDWGHKNQHRTDIVRLSDHVADVFQGRRSGQGHCVNGKVIPVDERYFNHWNHNPWQLNTGGSGHTLGTGAVFTLPYYMGLYHGFIAKDAASSNP